MQVDELKGIEDSLLYETLRLLIVPMKISGIFFVRKKGSFAPSLRGTLGSMTPLQVSAEGRVVFPSANNLKCKPTCPFHFMENDLASCNDRAFIVLILPVDVFSHTHKRIFVGCPL